VSHAREQLIRECFDLKCDFDYWEFRLAHFYQPELVARFPDFDHREKVLHGLWNLDSEERYPHYRAAMEDLSIAELEVEKEQWMDRLSLLSPKQYQEILAETSHRVAANDNAKGRER
jgi:hypothetical protein